MNALSVLTIVDLNEVEKSKIKQQNNNENKLIEMQLRIKSSG